MEMDIEYVKTRSLALDVNLLLRTPIAILARRGAA
jgi:lipopolysaccharide/colanic/teichoic acid biosynthesis glycosyltransferase